MTARVHFTNTKFKRIRKNQETNTVAAAYIVIIVRVKGTEAQGASRKKHREGQ